MNHIIFANSAYQSIDEDYGSWSVLVVDDSEAVHEAGEFALSGKVILGKKIQFIRAYDVDSARTILGKELDLDLVMLDCDMKTKTDGLELAHHIKVELKKTVPVILRTGFVGLGLKTGKKNIPTYIDYLLLKTDATIETLEIIVTECLSMGMEVKKN